MTDQKKIYLNCSFDEKDECKSLGGKWDPDKKKWYVSSGDDLQPFSKWLVGEVSSLASSELVEDVSKDRSRFPLITGPHKLLMIETEDPNYLRLYFDDNVSKARKLSRGGAWPSVYAEELLKKAEVLKNTLVYLKTSQYSKDWDPTEWIMDITPTEEWEKKQSILRNFEKEKSKSFIQSDVSVSSETSPDKATFDGKGKTHDTSQFVYFPGNRGLTVVLLDSIFESGFFKNPDDFDEFKTYVEKDFESSFYNKKHKRDLPNRLSRIRIGDGRFGKSKSYRMVVYEPEPNEDDVYVFYGIHIDHKLENQDFPSDREIKKFKKISESLQESYTPN